MHAEKWLVRLFKRLPLSKNAVTLSRHTRNGRAWLYRAPLAFRQGSRGLPHHLRHPGRQPPCAGVACLARLPGSHHRRRRGGVASLDRLHAHRSRPFGFWGLSATLAGMVRLRGLCCGDRLGPTQRGCVYLRTCSLSSTKMGMGFAGGFFRLKSSTVCSWPVGCCARHSSSSRRGHAIRTALVRCTLA